jgi:SAM-dependent methyltransferase
VLYNASLHYSTDSRATLREALRVLLPGGCTVILDSPLYRHDSSGRQMLAERQAAFARDLDLRWRVWRPWYGWQWALRPWRARLMGQREPSRFTVLVAAHRL